VSTAHRVFISSTYLDNATRRKLVEDAVINTGMIPIGIGAFHGQFRPTVEECVRLSREADVLVGIVSRRYGRVPDGHERSISELEYEAARERLMFVLDDNAAVDPEVDEGPLAASRNEANLISGRRHSVSWHVRWIESAIPTPRWSAFARPLRQRARMIPRKPGSCLAALRRFWHAKNTALSCGRRTRASNISGARWQAGASLFSERTRT
jgi:hypothetical protein